MMFKMEGIFPGHCDRETGYRTGEANCYNELGSVYHMLGDDRKAIEYQEKASLINKQLGR